MTATYELRRMLTEAGVEYRWDSGTVAWYIDGVMYYAWGFDNERLTMSVCHLTPAQAIAATVWRGTCGKVYLVEVSDDLLEGWYPMTVYLHRESAEDCAEALRKKEDGIWQFARVSELKVVAE